MPFVNSNHGISHNEVEIFFSKLLDTVKLLSVPLSEFEQAETSSHVSSDEVAISSLKLRQISCRAVPL